MRMTHTRREKRDRERQRDRETERERRERVETRGGKYVEEKRQGTAEREKRKDLPVLRKRFKRIQDATRPLSRRDWCPGPSDQDG